MKVVNADHQVAGFCGECLLFGTDPKANGSPHVWVILNEKPLDLTGEIVGNDKNQVMNYIKVKWIHSFPEEPIWLYSEIDNKRLEVRKIDLFANGVMFFADKHKRFGNIELCELALPESAEIAADPQFEAFTITQSEFETLWKLATSNGKI